MKMKSLDDTIVGLFKNGTNDDDYFHFYKRFFWRKPGRIRWSHTCSICKEGFTDQHKMWTTQCGHMFHKKCLQAYSKCYPSMLFCPLCRQSMGSLEFLDGLIYQVGTGCRSFLDQLEEIENMIPSVCTEGDHWRGIERTCETCCLYQQTGQKYIL